MGRDPVALVRAFLAEHNPPLRVWLAPRAAVELGGLVRRTLPPEAEFCEVPADAPVGPAILLATAADLAGEHRAALLRLAGEALPGRPVIAGGTANKDTLLDAMNTWHVFHLLPASPSARELGDAIVRAHRASALEHAAVQCAHQLTERCAELRAVMADLRATRERLLHAERLTTVGSFCRALSARLREHVERLRALEASLRALPDDPRRAELLDFTMQSVRAIDALLAELLSRAEATEPPRDGPGGGPTDEPPP